MKFVIGVLCLFCHALLVRADVLPNATSDQSDISCAFTKVSNKESVSHLDESINNVYQEAEKAVNSMPESTDKNGVMDKLKEAKKAYDQSRDKLADAIIKLEDNRLEMERKFDNDCIDTVQRLTEDQLLVLSGVNNEGWDNLLKYNHKELEKIQYALEKMNDDNIKELMKLSDGAVKLVNELDAKAISKLTNTEKSVVDAIIKLDDKTVDAILSLGENRVTEIGVDIVRAIGESGVTLVQALGADGVNALRRMGSDSVEALKNLTEEQVANLKWLESDGIDLLRKIGDEGIELFRNVGTEAIATYRTLNSDVVDSLQKIMNKGFDLAALFQGALKQFGDWGIYVLESNAVTRGATAFVCSVVALIPIDLILKATGVIGAPETAGAALGLTALGMAIGVAQSEIDAFGQGVWQKKSPEEINKDRKRAAIDGLVLSACFNVLGRIVRTVNSTGSKILDYIAKNRANNKQRDLLVRQLTKLKGLKVSALERLGTLRNELDDLYRKLHSEGPLLNDVADKIALYQKEIQNQLREIRAITTGVNIYERDLAALDKKILSDRLLFKNVLMEELPGLFEEFSNQQELVSSFLQWLMEHRGDSDDLTEYLPQTIEQLMEELKSFDASDWANLFSSDIFMDLIEKFFVNLQSYRFEGGGDNSEKLNSEDDHSDDGENDKQPGSDNKKTDETSDNGTGHEQTEHSEDTREGGQIDWNKILQEYFPEYYDPNNPNPSPEVPPTNPTDSNTQSNPSNPNTPSNPSDPNTPSMDNPRDDQGQSPDTPGTKVDPLSPTYDPWGEVFDSIPEEVGDVCEKVLSAAEGYAGKQLDKLIAKYPGLQNVLNHLGIDGTGIVRGVVNIIGVLVTSPDLGTALGRLTDMALNSLKQIAVRLIQWGVQWLAQKLLGNMLIPQVVKWVENAVSGWAVGMATPVIDTGLQALRTQIEKCAKRAGLKINPSAPTQTTTKFVEELISNGKKNQQSGTSVFGK